MCAVSTQHAHVSMGPLLGDAGSTPVSPRTRLLEAVDAALGNRSLVWFGTRGDDVESLTQLPQLRTSLSIISPLAARSAVEAYSLEEGTNRRVDLDTYDIDDHLDEAQVRQFRRRLLGALGRKSALLCYRPSHLVSSAAFARQDHCLELSLFKEFQAAFEHKPWVESAIRGLEIPAIPWRYIADVDHATDVLSNAGGQIIIRPSRSSGGVGLFKVANGDELAELWPHHSDGLVSIAPFYENVIPVNIGGVVWDEGVTLHHPSIQLIGVPELTQREFGYCGNDFANVRSLESATILQIEKSSRVVGLWLRGRGYRGAFGIDYLVRDGVPLFTEVNPRFQGSTYLSSWMSATRGEGCILLEHLAAMLRIPMPSTKASLAERVFDQPPVSHMVFHAVESGTVDTSQAARAARSFDRFLRDGLRPEAHVHLDQGSSCYRLAVRGSVTQSGFTLVDDAALFASDVLNGIRMFPDAGGPRDLAEPPTSTIHLAFDCQ